MINFFRKLFNKKEPVQVQKYQSYEDYINHQKEKTTDPERREKWLGEEWELKLNFFESKFSEYQERFFDESFKKAVGLGARTGQEVQAFKNIGLDAIGIDLVPCEPLVIEGDIHDMPFHDSEFDVAFTNVFDHSLYPQKFVREIERILKKGGIAIIHLAMAMETDQYGVTEVYKDKAVIELFDHSNVLISQKMPYWGGMTWEIVMKKAN